LKGGHADGALAIDHYFDGAQLVELQSPRINTTNTHGSGCVFSATITAALAKGSDPLAAVHEAKEFITGAIELALEAGRGHGPVNPMFRIVG
jgi:hydroxymethylpyrimidine/phosphomethylpyrimidine kinase